MVYYNNFIIDSAKLLENVAQIKSNIGDAKLCAIVKADAYGHKSAVVCDILKDVVDYFGVSSVMEARAVRISAPDTHILVLGKTAKRDYFYCSKNNIDIAVSSLHELEDISSVLRRLKLRVHIAVNTGMNRYGVSDIAAFRQMLDYISSHQANIKLVGVFSHFATKSTDVDFIHAQFDKFMEFTADLPRGVIRHIASSYVANNIPSMTLDMTRCGYSLYDGKENILSIDSKVVEVIDVDPGQSIGYDRTFTADRNSRIGVIPIGYGDGFDRRLSNNFKLYSCGQFIRVVGNVCMDCTLVDLTDTKIGLGDTVEILGSHITYSDYAKALSTSNYDVMLKFRYRRMNYIVK